MELQSIENTVRQLVRLHQSNDPFKLAEACGIIVVRENLGTIRGYFGKSYGSRVIHVNDGLNEVDARFTCAHELGHAILHPKTNTPFLRGNTLFSVNKLERQANLFAVCLLCPHELMEEGKAMGYTVGQIASQTGIPEEMLVWRIAG